MLTLPALLFRVSLTLFSLIITSSFLVMLVPNSLRNRYGNAINLVNDLLVLLMLGGFVSISPGAAKATDMVRILALGDSLTAGYGLPKKDSFPSQLERALLNKGISAKVTNGGVSGDTSAGGVSRLDWLLSEGFDGVIIELGANDGLRGLEPKETQKNLNSIINLLKQKNIAVLLTGMQAPPNLGSDYGKEFTEIFSYLATKHKIVFFPFFLEGVATVVELNQKDGIHPNLKGVEVIVKNILPYVEEMLMNVKRR